MLALRIDFLTEGTERALAAFGAACRADFATIENNPVAEVTALLRRQNLSQLLFNLFRVLALGKPQPTADADAVGIADHTAGGPV